MNPNDFSDHVTLNLSPPEHQCLHLSSEGSPVRDLFFLQTFLPNPSDLSNPVTCPQYQYHYLPDMWF